MTPCKRLMLMSYTSVHLFAFEGRAARWYAFRQMGLAQRYLATAGSSFCKLLGTGGGAGFSLRPDWGTYALLMVWPRREDADAFFHSNRWYAKYRRRASEVVEIEARAFRSQGLWNGVNPFAEQSGNEKAPQMMVLTRASIKPRLLPVFWRYVPGVSQRIFRSQGLLWAKGVGERPLLEQATLSVWDSQALMQDFAYRQKEHREVVQKTRQLNWYSEELFARFSVERVSTNAPWLKKNSAAPVEEVS